MRTSQGRTLSIDDLASHIHVRPASLIVEGILDQLHASTFMVNWCLTLQHFQSSWTSLQIVTATPLCVHVTLWLQHPNIGKAAILLIKVQPIANHELVRALRISQTLIIKFRQTPRRHLARRIAWEALHQCGASAQP